MQVPVDLAVSQEWVAVQQFVFDLTMSEENSQFKEMNTLTNSTYSAAYNEALVLKAMFEKDENWNPSELKLYLNEIAIANNQYVDEYGKSKDWIEIYNGGSSSVDLGGMFLSDKRGNLKKYEKFLQAIRLKTIVPAKGYIIFWADQDTLLSVHQCIQTLRCLKQMLRPYLCQECTMVNCR